MNHDRRINSDDLKARRSPSVDPLRPSILPEELSLPTAGFAVLVGLTTQTVGDWARRGLLSRSEEGRLLVVESVQRYCDELRQAAGRHGAGKRDPAKVRLTEAQAALAEVRVARARGELVPAAEVERAWSGILRGLRAELLALPTRVGSRLGLLASEVEAIDREIRDCLEALACAEPSSPIEREMTDEEFADAARALL